MQHSHTCILSILSHYWCTKDSLVGNPHIRYRNYSQGLNSNLISTISMTPNHHKQHNVLYHMLNTSCHWQSSQKCRRCNYLLICRIRCMVMSTGGRMLWISKIQERSYCKMLMMMSMLCKEMHTTSMNWRKLENNRFRILSILMMISSSRNER